ncbi:MAG: DUF86 domain-containing protein [Chloroflexi bacterium]|nr:DUF86 domain-containing protein [Chloroflexota bacterium]
MARDQRAYLVDILEAITELQAHTGGWSEENLLDRWNSWAVMKALEIIGEAAGHLESETRAAIAGIPWANIIGMRNILVHAYFRAATKDIWNTLKNDLQPLKEVRYSWLNPLRSRTSNRHPARRNRNILRKVGDHRACAVRLGAARRLHAQIR